MIAKSHEQLSVRLTVCLSLAARSPAGSIVLSGFIDFWFGEGFKQMESDAFTDNRTHCGHAEENCHDNASPGAGGRDACNGVDQ